MKIDSWFWFALKVGTVDMLEKIAESIWRRLRHAIILARVVTREAPRTVGLMRRMWTAVPSATLFLRAMTALEAFLVGQPLAYANLIHFQRRALIKWFYPCPACGMSLELPPNATKCPVCHIKDVKPVTPCFCGHRFKNWEDIKNHRCSQCDGKHASKIEVRPLPPLPTPRIVPKPSDRGPYDAGPMPPAQPANYDEDGVGKHGC